MNLIVYAYAFEPAALEVGMINKIKQLSALQPVELDMFKVYRFIGE